MSTEAGEVHTSATLNPTPTNATVGPLQAVAVGPREAVAPIRALEREIVLLDAQDGDLYRSLEGLVWERTSGVIGSVSDLIRQAANEAVGTVERITEEGLRAIRLDRASEEREVHNSRAKRTGTRRPSAA